MYSLTEAEFPSRVADVLVSGEQLVKHFVHLGEGGSAPDLREDVFLTAQYLFPDATELDVVGLFHTEDTQLSGYVSPVTDILQAIQGLEAEIEASGITSELQYATMESSFGLLCQFGNLLEKTATLVLRVAHHKSKELSSKTPLHSRLRSLLAQLAPFLSDYLQACLLHSGSPLDRLAVLLAIASRLPASALPNHFLSAAICVFLQLCLVYLQAPHQPWRCPEWTAHLTAKAVSPGAQAKQRSWILESILLWKKLLISTSQSTP